MKILLVNPPRSPENSILRFAPDEARPFIHKKLIGPPLGLLTIAAAVKDHDVTVFDMKGEYDLDPETPPLPILTEKLIKTYSPDVVGVTVITSEFNLSNQVSNVVKAFDPSILTIAGGLHPTLCPEDFQCTSFDMVLPGQCAPLFREVILALESGRKIETIPGLYLNSDGILRKTTGKPRPANFISEGFLMPDRNHLSRWINTYKVGKSPDPSTYLYTSLGCPYKCTFCSIWNQFGGKYYQRTIDSLIAELKSTDDYPVVRFADANTVVDTGFMSHLFDHIREEGIRKTFIMDIRADVAAGDPSIIEKMARGGLKVVICGFESFRDDELNRYRKKSPAALNEEAIRVFDANGIMVRGNYVVPCDYSRDDFSALADYAARNPVVYAGYTILSPMPGTVYYQEVRNKIVDHNFDRYNFFNALLETKFTYEEFHHEVAKLWLIRKGTDVI
ncbi:MAG: radical SAM protein [bacterium]